MSFLKPVGRFIGKNAPLIAGAAAAPFTGGASLWPTLGKLGIGIGASMLGGKIAGGTTISSKDMSALLKEQLESIREGRQIASGLQPQAANLLEMATSTYLPVVNYYNRLLSGNRGEAMAAMQPEVSRVNEGYDQALQSAAALAPRGGGRSALFSELPFQRVRDITTLLNSIRPGAAEGLLRAGGQAANTAQGLYSTLLSALSGSQAARTGLMGYDLQSRQERFKRAQEIGSTLYDIFFPPKVKNPQDPVYTGDILYRG
jgi:hypothetical protein